MKSAKAAAASTGELDVYSILENSFRKDMDESVKRANQILIHDRKLVTNVCMGGDPMWHNGVFEWPGDASLVKFTLSLKANPDDGAVYLADPLKFADFRYFIWVYCVDRAIEINTVFENDGDVCIVRYQGRQKDKPATFELRFRVWNEEKKPRPVLVPLPVRRRDPVQSAYSNGSVTALITRVSALLEELRR
jgi:hypothetical protein